MEQLLKTQELQKLQKDRANAKRLVTKSASKLKTSLVLGTGEKYDFSKLNKRVIQEDYDKVKDRYNDLQKSHELYVSKCLEAAEAAVIDKAAIESFEAQEEEDLDSYRVVAYEGIGLYEFEYKSALDQYILNLQEEAKSSSISPAKVDVKKEKTEARRMLNRWSCLKEEWKVLIGGVKKTTDTTCSLTFDQLKGQNLLLDADRELEVLEREWKSLNEFYQELLIQLENADYKDAALTDAVQFNMTENIISKADAVFELRRLAEFQKIRKSESEVKIKEVEKVADKVEGSALKLKGLTAPQFSGKAEDFASWKERFLALVPKGRSKEEVAALLEL